MKKITLVLLTMISILLESGIVLADTNSLYDLHPIQTKNFYDDSEIEYKVTGYQYLKDPVPLTDNKARYLIIHCEANTSDLSKNSSDSIINSDVCKVYDCGHEAVEIEDVVPQKVMKKQPLKNVKSINKVKPNKIYKFDYGVIVYPYDKIILKINPYNFQGLDSQKIIIHAPDSKNGIVLNSMDSLADYAQGGFNK